LGRSRQDGPARFPHDGGWEPAPQELAPDLVEHLTVAEILTLPRVEAKRKKGGGLELFCRAELCQGGFTRCSVDAARGELPGDGHRTFDRGAPTHVRPSKGLVIQNVRLVYPLDCLFYGLLLVTALAQLSPKLFSGVVAPA
jgi:hypothetical protein